MFGESLDNQDRCLSWGYLGRNKYLPTQSSLDLGVVVALGVVAGV